jgi:hypothetical protein
MEWNKFDLIGLFPAAKLPEGNMEGPSQCFFLFSFSTYQKVLTGLGASWPNAWQGFQTFGQQKPF